MIIPIYDTENTLTEAYFGKTPTIQEAERVLARLIREMKKTPVGDFTNHPLNKKFEKLIQKQFGWKNFYMIWNNSPASKLGTSTFISSDILYNRKNVNFVDKTKGFYDKNHSHTAYVQSEPTMVLNYGLTAPEMMAVLLHEFGHNFDNSVYGVVGLLLSYALAINDIVNSIPTIGGTFKYGLSDPNIDIVAKSKLVKNIGTFLYKRINLFVASMPFGKKMHHVIKEIESELIEKIPKLKPCIAIYNVMFDAFSTVNNFRHLTLSLLNMPNIIMKAPMHHLAKSLTRKGETFADSFAAAYGYGPELAVGLSKLTKTSLNPLSLDVDNMPSITKAVYDFYKAESYFIQFLLGSGHGTEDTRIHAVTRQIKSELNDPNIPRGLKKELEAQVIDLEKTYNDFLSTENEDTKLVITALLRGALNKIFRGESDFIAKFLPENTVNTRFKESTSYMADIDDMCEAMVESVLSM